MSLPAGITVFERGWLSANGILFRDGPQAALVDSGYCTHSAQTLALVADALGDQPLGLLINTHLHSDHCGGNAALQARYPGLDTRIPPGLADQVRQWDPVALSYAPTGQQCPRFSISGVIEPGSEVRLGELMWQVHAAPGHDRDSIVLFEPSSRTLISADALWENGFGVVFEELEGDAAFAEVAATFDLIEALEPTLVIPGHGGLFSDVAAALATARRRLDGFVKSPTKHATHAAKVLVKFKLLEMQQLHWSELSAWAESTPYFGMVHQRWFAQVPAENWLRDLVDSLVGSAAARRDGEFIINV